MILSKVMSKKLKRILYQDYHFMYKQVLIFQIKIKFNKKLIKKLQKLKWVKNFI